MPATSKLWGAGGYALDFIEHLLRASVVIGEAECFSPARAPALSIARPSWPTGPF
ncbi:hypothetical protein DFAR_310006 [Desulfarculales bacterium]